MSEHPAVKRLFLAVKFLALLLATWYLIQYFLLYGLWDRISQASMTYLLVALVASLTGFMVQVTILKVLSNGKLSLADSFTVEFYALALNLGVTSSFFSIPKIALLNNKLGDLKASTRLFALPMVYGLVGRVFFIVFAGSILFLDASQSTLMILMAALTSLTVLKLRKKRPDRFGSLFISSFYRVFPLILVNIFTVFLSYYLTLASLDARPPMAAAIFSEGVGYLSGLLSPMPSGLGVREIALTKMGDVMGLAQDISFNAAILHRFVVVAGQLLVGAAFLAVMRLFNFPQQPSIKA